MTVTADNGTMQEVALIVGREIRDTDMLGHTDEGTLALVLLDSDYEHSTRVIDRVVSRMETMNSRPRFGSRLAPPVIPPMPSTPAR